MRAAVKHHARKPPRGVFVSVTPPPVRSGTGHLHNAEIADLFDRFALLLEIEGANPFRVRAYHNAARTIENLPRDINMMLGEGADLTELPGIGEDLAHKITEMATTGRFAELEAIKRRLPSALTDLAEIPGLGPQRIKTLFRKLKIKSLKEVATAAQAGRLQKLPGFGPKIEQNILKAVERHISSERRTKLMTAEQIASPLVRYLEAVPGVAKVTVAGSYRRRKDTVGDIDILVTSSNSAKPIEAFVTYGEVSVIMAQGTTRATIRLKSGLQVDLRVVPERSYGAALVYFTGSKAHNIALRAMGMKRGLKFNEYGVFKGKKWLAGQTEKEVYAKVGLPYIEPELRENQGELEAALAGHLPRLIATKDIKGDLHVHTDASDGEDTIEDMAAAAKKLGYEYLAITDHSKRMGIVHGLDAKRLVKQIAQIDRLNASLRGIHILKSTEVDILADGSLALEDEVLRELDLVVAAVHSKFDLDAQRQTDRIIHAMDNHYVNIIAHPSGRLLGEREAYQLDMKRLIKAALDRGCYLEVNGQPSRLDLTDVHCRMAKEMGLKVAISTDAHTADTLAYMRYGIDQARRGWLEKDDVLNTRDFGALRKLLKR
jgi:DNA polymerase (family 10)